MGCGAMGATEVGIHQRPLSSKIQQHLNQIKRFKMDESSNSFITANELRLLQQNIKNIPQHFLIEEIPLNEEKEKYLLTPERRIIWKLSLMSLPLDRFPNQKKYYFQQQPNNERPISKKIKEQIALDIGRTYPSISNINRDDLKFVLQNISSSFEEVGYTQGMNFIVAFLLLCGFTREQTIQMFIRMAESRYFVLIRNFSEGFKNVHICTELIELLITEKGSQNLKVLRERISSVMSIMLIVFSWFLTYFLYSTNIRCSVLIWDYLLLHSPILGNEQSLPSTKQSPQIDSYFGCGFTNTINFTFYLLQSLSEKMETCQTNDQLMQLLVHHSIQQYLTIQKVQQIIYQCKASPIIDWRIFRKKIEEKDTDLFRMIIDLENRQIQAINYKTEIDPNKIQSKQINPDPVQVEPTHFQ